MSPIQCKDMKRGLSLMELLVVLAVILVITAIVLPVLMAAKQRSNKVGSFSNLHQLGLAASLYAADHDDKSPRSVVQLVKGNYAPMSLVADPRDKTVEGLGVRIAVAVAERATKSGRTTLAEVPFRFSYIGLSEYMITEGNFEKWVATADNPGWLLDLTDAQPKYDFDKAYVMAQGTYNRLLLDGSIARRRFFDLQCNDGKSVSPCRMELVLFFDPGQEFLQSVASGTL